MEDARRYERVRYAISATAFVLNAAFLLCLLMFHWTASIRDLAERVFSPTTPSGVILIYALIVGAAFTLIELPLDFLSGYVLEHRFGLSRQSLGGWLKDQIKGLVLGGALGLAGIEIVYYLLRSYPHSWWLIASSLFVAFFVAVTNLAPVLLLPLFFKFTPVQDPNLQRRVESLAKRTGTRVCGIFEWALGEKTRKANAAVVGWGNTRRIIVSDTLLKNFSGEEIEVIMAHELCHHVKAHIWWGMALQAVLTFASFFAVDRVLRLFAPHFHSISDVANFPLLSLAALLVSLLALPGANYFSRCLETAADLYALDITGDALAFVSSMEKLADLNLANRSPNPILEFIFYSHPSIDRRIQLAANRVGQIV